MSGSDFARRQLKKHGWTEGAGLGKQEDGRAEPIKVSLKMDKTGVGHDPGKEFTDHWWLRVFNEAAQKIGESKQEEASSDDEEKKKKEKMAADQRNFYKGFVKSSTLTNGIEEKDKNSDSDSNDESTDDTNGRIPTLDDIHKFCGGATGHRAARFGIKMKGKLSRVAEHDQKFEEKLRKEPSSALCGDNTPGISGTALLVTCDSSVISSLKDKKKKSKRKKQRDENEAELGTGVQHSNEEMPGLNTDGESSSNKKKKKKRRQEKDSPSEIESHKLISSSSEITITDVLLKSSGDKSKTKKKRKKVDVCIEIEETKSLKVANSCTHSLVDDVVLGDFDSNGKTNSESSSDNDVRRKKKKNKDQKVVITQELEIQEETVQKVKKRKKEHQDVRNDSQDVAEEKSVKKKKRKKDKTQEFSL